jgi:biotin carboxylase
MSINLPCLAVLAGPEASLSPSEIVRSAENVADVAFLLDLADQSEQGENLRAVAGMLGPTATVDFADIAACMAALRSWGASAATTFTDRLCQVTARLNAEIKGTSGPAPQWGSKDTQRRMLRAAGMSEVGSIRVSDESSLRAFAESAGFPVVVKPVGGASSRDTWLLSQESDIAPFMRESGAGENRHDMFAEQFIVGDSPPKPYLGDYVSVEMLRFGQPATESGPARTHAWVTDRLFPAWPCRETGFFMPSQWSSEQQESLIASAGTALDALGCKAGAFHVEIKPKRPTNEIIEVNGRLGGFVSQIVRYGTGVDIGRLALSCALDRYEPLELHWDRCISVLFYQAPPRAAHIKSAPSRKDVSRLPGVLSVDHVHGAGTAVDWRNGTNSCSARVWITADDHTGLRTSLIDIATFLTDEFCFIDAAGQPVRDRTWLECLAREL